MAIRRRRRCSRCQSWSGCQLERITGHPLAYVGRLDGVMAELLDESLPLDDAAYRDGPHSHRPAALDLDAAAFFVSRRLAKIQRPSRLRARRLGLGERPADRLAAAGDPLRRRLVVRRWRQRLFAVVRRAMCAVMRGAAVAAPRETVNGAQRCRGTTSRPGTGRFWTHVRRTRGRRYFVTPTAGGHVDLSRLLLVSRPLGRDALGRRVPARGGARRGRLFEGLAPRRVRRI